MNLTPHAREKLAIVLNNFAMFGFKQTLKDVCVYLLTRPNDDFDARHGVQTADHVRPSEAGIADTAALDTAVVYEPTHARVMQHILSYVECHLTPSELSFLDLGCGKGRAVLMASELPFKAVIGVELSPVLCELARENAARYRTRAPSTLNGARRTLAPIRIVQGDATRFELPDSDLLVYLFNPFRAPVVRAVLNRLAAFQRRSGRRVFVALSSPLESEYVLRAHPAFSQLREFRVILRGHSWSLWRCDRSERVAHDSDLAIDYAEAP